MIGSDIGVASNPNRILEADFDLDLLVEVEVIKGLWRKLAMTVRSMLLRKNEATTFSSIFPAFGNVAISSPCC
jgi:hypothetical protein